MSSSTSDEEFELNYVKVDSKNEIRLIGKEDYEIETYTFMSTVAEFGQEKMGKNLTNFLKSKIPENQDIIKLNTEYSKPFLKPIIADKKKCLNTTINQILSIDFKDKFIFNKTNVQIVSNILTYVFNESIKKYKIPSLQKDFKNAINKILFEKYDFFKIFANNEYLKNKDKEKIDLTLSRGSSQCKSTTISSFNTPVYKDLYEETSDIVEENNSVNELNRYHNEARSMYYIDNNIKNIMCSSWLTNDFNYNEEEELKKLLTKECFIYPKYNKNTISEQKEFPIELTLLLYKLKKVKTLVFQIQNIDEQFMKMAILILINVKWLFISDIEEIKFDLGNEEIQQGLCEMFNERTGELYHHFQKNKNLIYYKGTYQARKINCWEPEGDIFFEKFENFEKKDNNKKTDYLYNHQSNEETSTFDNHLCNIYNEIGNLTNLKYIRPINYTIRNKFNEFQYDQKIEDYDDNNTNFEALNISVGDIQRLERESIALTNTLSFNNRVSNANISQTMNINNIQTNNNNLKSTPQLLGQFVNKYKSYFEMISIYSYFFQNNLKRIKKLCLFFHTPFSYEICLLFNMKLHFDNSHFLILANKIETLTEVDFSFNSLDDKSFEYILGIINKNINISSLKLSFFTPDINYYDNSLFNLCSAKKISLTKLFQDQREFEIKYSQNKEKRINNYILNEKLLLPFATNLCNFFNLLKMQSLNKLEEFIMRFDIPLPLLDNEKYINLIIKFLINILIMITFQENKIQTFKILAPNLELNCTTMPYIRQLFKEISLKDEIEEKMNNILEIKERRKIKQRTIKEQREKENELFVKKKELKQKIERKQLLEKMNCKDDIIIESTKEITINDDDLDMDMDKKIEKYEYKRYKSVAQKIPKEQAARRNESILIEDITNKNRSELNKNCTLQNLVLQMKIYKLPEIFNICLMNNLNGLKSINIGSLDEITFIGFMNGYKNYHNKLINLTSLKISLGVSITYFSNLEKYILEFININSPKIEEKFLFSDLQILNENKMKELIELVYIKATVPKLVIQISNENEHMLSKVISKYINESKSEMNSLIILMDKPEFKKLYNTEILECLFSFYGKKKNRAIICKENPNTTTF